MSVLRRLASLLGGVSNQNVPARRAAPVPTGTRMPDQFDLSNPDHVILIDEIREAFSKVMMQEDADEFRGCLFRPSSTLPYPKASIDSALKALLGFLEGRASSPYLPPDLRSNAASHTVRGCLVFLDSYIDAPAAELPRSPLANSMYGDAFSEALAAGASVEVAQVRAKAAVAVLVEFDRLRQAGKQDPATGRHDIR